MNFLMQVTPGPEAVWVSNGDQQVRSSLGTVQSGPGCAQPLPHTRGKFWPQPGTCFTLNNYKQLSGISEPCISLYRVPSTFLKSVWGGRFSEEVLAALVHAGCPCHSVGNSLFPPAPTPKNQWLGLVHGHPTQQACTSIYRTTSNHWSQKKSSSLSMDVY